MWPNEFVVSLLDENAFKTTKCVDYFRRANDDEELGGLDYVNPIFNQLSRCSLKFGDLMIKRNQNLNFVDPSGSSDSALKAGAEDDLNQKKKLQN